MEPIVRELVQAGIAVDLLIPAVKDDEGQVGVRLRTMGKQLPKNRMIMATGANFMEALDNAAGKAEQRRWENLDWAARPWPVADRRDLNVLASWGLS